MTYPKPCHFLAALCVALLPAISWATPFAYIANFNSNSVSVVDTASNTVTATVAVGSNPYGVSVNPAGTRVYVSNNNGGSVSVIDTASHLVVATVPVGSNPTGVSVNPAGTRVYVANYGSNTVSVIDTGTNSVTATVAVGSHPVGAWVNPVGNQVYVADNSSTSISVIDTTSNTVTATVRVGSAPYGAAVNPTGTRVYVANLFGDSVSVVDTSTNAVIATIAVGASPYGVAVNPAGTRVYVTNSNNGSNSVSVIDTASNTVTATVAVGNSPEGVAVSQDGTRVYVVNQGSNSVTAIDTASNTVAATVTIGAGPIGLGNFIGPGTATTVAPAAVPTDPIPPLTGMPAVPGISSQLVALDLASGQGPTMTNCLLATVRSLLGSDAQYLGQSVNGVAKFSLSGGRFLAFYPVQASTFAGQTNDIHLTGSNILNIGTSCGYFNVTPALNSLNDFGSIVNGMGLKASINAQGTMTLLVGNTVYVARPDYLATGGSTTSPHLAQGSDGLYRVTDSAGNVQILRPAFVDADGLPGAAQAALSSGGTTTIQTDGTAVFTAINGTQYVLTPDLTLTAASAVNAALYNWQDTPNHYLYRSSLLTLAQGFTVQRR